MLEKIEQYLRGTKRKVTIEFHPNGILFTDSTPCFTIRIDPPDLSKIGWRAETLEDVFQAMILDVA